MFVESVLFSALAMATGGGVCMVGYSIIIQYLPYAVPDYYMFVTIGVGVIVGYFCTSMVKAAALKIIYSVKGGFLCGSAVSYIFWKQRMWQGDFWLENLVSNGVGLDPTRWTTWTCIDVHDHLRFRRHPHPKLVPKEGRQEGRQQEGRGGGLRLHQ